MSTITQFPSGNTQYRIEFDYLSRTFVVITLVNSSNPALNRVLEVGRDYRFLNPTMIEMLVDQSGFDIVRIHRQTGTDLVVDFRNGSVLTAGDLTNAELQAIHIAEEGRDQTVDLAKEYADAAGSSAGNAKDSEDEARRIAESIKASGLIGYITRRSFEKGFDVIAWNEVLLWEEDGDYYRWDGTLPKNVPAGSTPETSGGIGLGAWVSVGDASLRTDLASDTGFTLIGGKGFIMPEDFGAKGDALLQHTSQLSKLVSSSTPGIVNQAATDDTAAFLAAIAHQKETGLPIKCDGGKGYLISKSLVIDYSNANIDGCGAVIVYKGGRVAGSGVSANYGIFQLNGTYSRTTYKATVSANVDALTNNIIINTSGNTLVKGAYTVFYARNDVLDSEWATKVKTEAYCIPQVRKIIDNGNGTSTLVLDYKTGFSWSASQVTLGTSSPLENITIENFTLIDEMVVTPTPDILPVPEAPALEKAEAVALVRGVCIANCHFRNLRSYKAKYSTVDIFLANNCTFSNIQTFYPVWFGGGEGYCVRVANSIYCTSDRLSMTGGRHVTDYTLCGHCSTHNSHGETDQVSFSMHTSSEHDITFNHCTGGDFYLANEVYGMSCVRVTLRNCSFDHVRINCLDLLIDRCFLKDFQATCNKLVIVGSSNIYDFQFANKDARAYADDILTSYGARPGVCVVSDDSSLTRKSGYTAGTQFGGWYSLELHGRVATLTGDSRSSLNLVDVAAAKVDGSFQETVITSSGILRSIDLTGVTGEFTGTSTSAFYNIASLSVPEGYIASLILRGMHLRLNGTMRPYQIVTRADSVRAWAAVISVGGSVFINTLAGQIRDTNRQAPVLDIVGLCATQDSYNSTTLRTDISAIQFPLISG